MCAIATSAGSIDWDCSCGRADKRCLVPHHAGTARNLLNRLTLHAQTNDKRRDLGFKLLPDGGTELAGEVVDVADRFGKLNGCACSRRWRWQLNLRG